MSDLRQENQELKRILRGILQVANDAKRHPTAIAIEDALEASLLTRWRTLTAKARKILSNEPS